VTDASGTDASGTGASGTGASAERPSAEPDPRDERGWGALGDRLRLAGDGPAADRAYLRQIRATLTDPDLIAAAETLDGGDPKEAHRLLSGLLARRPSDTTPLRMFADLAARTGRHRDAEALLARCLNQAPDLAAARCAYAIALHQQGKTLETIAQTDILLEADPSHPLYRQLRGAALMRIGDDAAAAEAYEAVLAAMPGLALTWMAYGHALKTLGRQADAVAAYRESLRLRPGLGEAWWSLANLKTVALGPADIERMEGALEDPALDEEDRFHLLFALGKALEDAGAYELAFRRYEEANARRRAGLAYDPDEATLHVARCKALFSPSFFAGLAGRGSPRPDPIFIVGLPRSGSTLIEQILASHSQVEGTQELPDIDAMAARLGGHASRPSGGAYPEVLAALSAGELNALGEEYLQRTRVYRKTTAPIFIDKMPNNFAHIGLIHLILPNAKIVDARRHPMGCCFSAFKQHFASGQPFTYGLADLGRYYRDYVELMAHFDAVLPGRVHRVIYEQLVADPEAQVRRLLDYCGLPFEAGCLRFYENDRAVHTASSEQVRQPIFTDATDHWRRFQPWLGPLEASLGPVIETYPDAPPF
jgi:tetratricopeptide (TPR) repeat protein